MKALLIAMFMVLSVTLCAEDKASVMPENITLTTGTVLRKISVIRWNKDSVLIKHAGGIDPIRFGLIPPAILETMRAVKIIAPEDKEVTLSGEIFIVTNGRSNVLLGSTHVRLYKSNLKPVIEAAIHKAVEDAKNASNKSFFGAPLAMMNEKLAEGWRAMIAALPAPDAETYTDSQGKFTLSAKGNYYCLVVIEERQAPDLKERYAWALPKEEITNPGKIILSNHNQLAVN